MSWNVLLDYNWIHRRLLDLPLILVWPPDFNDCRRWIFSCNILLREMRVEGLAPVPCLTYLPVNGREIRFLSPPAKFKSRFEVIEEVSVAGLFSITSEQVAKLSVGRFESIFRGEWWWDKKYGRDRAILRPIIDGFNRRYRGRSWW